jgi:hypothetical protein
MNQVLGMMELETNHTNEKQLPYRLSQKPFTRQSNHSSSLCRKPQQNKRSQQEKLLARIVGSRVRHRL